jgi:hypothetical protein
LKPSNCLILETYPLNQNINSPINGWNINELPIPVDSTIINNLILENN